jgi:hypothetical protein
VKRGETLAFTVLFTALWQPHPTARNAPKMCLTAIIADFSEEFKRFFEMTKNIFDKWLLFTPHTTPAQLHDITHILNTEMY